MDFVQQQGKDASCMEGECAVISLGISTLDLRLLEPHTFKMKPIE